MGGLSAGVREKGRGRRGDEEVGAHTRAHAWTHIPIQTQVTLFEADGSHEEFPLGIERGGDKKETREGSGGGGVGAGWG